MSTLWRQETAEKFREIVQEAVRPVNEERKRGIHPVYLEGESARVQHRIGATAFLYFTYDLGRPNWPHGSHGLPFVPSHGFEMTSFDAFPNVREATGRHTFGLREDNVIMRSYTDMVGQVISFHTGLRELTEAETDRLLQVAQTPGAVTDIAPLTDEEYDRVYQARKQAESTYRNVRAELDDLLRLRPHLAASARPRYR